MADAPATPQVTSPAAVPAAAVAPAAPAVQGKPSAGANTATDQQANDQTRQGGGGRGGGGRGRGGGGRGGGRGGFRGGRPQEESQFIEKLININRVAKVHQGGKRLAFNALVVVGGRQGQGGRGAGQGQRSF